MGVVSLTPDSEPQRYGWMGSLKEMSEATMSALLEALSQHHKLCMLEPPSSSQIGAWKSSVTALKSAIQELEAARPEAGNWGVVLEYELPRERGRRPDVVLLAPGRLVVLEFKERPRALPEYLDQVEAYARDLEEYQAASRDLRVIPVLVLGGDDPSDHPQHVYVVEDSQLGALLVELLGSTEGVLVPPLTWVTADYAPLPSLVAAARMIFLHEPLPTIRKAQSAGIPQALQALSEAAMKAEASDQRHLAFVTGVPGAGKTLVGLQFVYSSRSDDATEKEAVFLSGNGPLVKVLQHALKSTVFVQDVHGFLKQYGGSSLRPPTEHIWVYDEAQRAWDAGRVLEKRGHGLSEPEDFLRLGARMPDWAMVVGLIGEGQEIHLGEEAGIGQWNDAIAASTAKWHVHCAPRMETIFGAAVSVTPDPSLDLTISLRSHLASDVQDWVRNLLQGRLDQAHTAAIRAQQAGYAFYLTDDLSRAERYVRERYAGVVGARYGLIASSKAKNLVSHGIHNDFAYTRRLREGKWFNDDPSSPDSCCQLRETVTEFQCQGLELDCPILCWGDDLWWEGSAWATRPAPRSTAKDPAQLRINSYRVLLSRGRDALVVFCPPDIDPATRQALVNSGLLTLP